MDYEKLKRFSADIRITMLKEMQSIGSGHIGGSASIADVLAVLYGGAMQIDPKNPDWADRDRFVLSKGHCGPALYAALALKGYFPMEWLSMLNAPKTRLPSHADRVKTPGVDMTTGSLGQGISSAVGIALGNRAQGRNSYTYCIIGDGEMEEGQVWEACESAAHFALDKFVLFVDWNKYQLDGTVEKICNPVDIEKKFEAFGFDAQTVKGYDTKEIYDAILRAKTVENKPHVIILDTIKGLGINFAEGLDYNHYLPVTKELADSAIEEIERRYAEGSYPVGAFKW
jgi:transketolase